MQWFKNMKIRTKLLAGFLVVIALVMTLVVLSLTQIDRVRAIYTVVIEHPISLRTTLVEFQSEYRNLRRIGATASLYAGRGEAEYEALFREADAAYDAALAHFDRALNIIGTNPLLTEEDRNFRLTNAALLRDLFSRYHDEVTVRIEKAVRAHDQQDILAVLEPAAANAEAVREQLAKLLVIAKNTELEHIARVDASARSTVTLLVSISIIATLLAVAIALYVANNISLPLAPLTRFMQNMATAGDIAFSPEDVANVARHGRNKDEVGRLIAAADVFVRRIVEVGGAFDTVSDGDLTAEIPVLSGRDSMGLAFRKMIENLNSMCGDIHASSIHVATGANQVTAGAQSLSAGATEQAASIEQLSVSIAEMAERTQTTAQMAGQAATLADTIKGSAEKSSGQMDEMMRAVGEISEASQSIRKIIKTIDEIAFQTNILAVNAAVEAAHAGKYGKGFSVVATEVRSLAAKSATAAKDTERLIANSIEKSELGVLIAGETSVSLSEIVSGINANNQLVSAIAQSAAEQSNNIAQINIGINQVSQVVQQNSSTAEESAAASEEMASQSAMLQKLAAQFRLKEEPKAFQPQMRMQPAQLRLPAQGRPAQTQLLLE